MTGLRQWLAMGSGIGLQASGEDILAAAVRVRPSGITLRGSETFAKALARPAAEWGAEYARWARSLGLEGQPAAWVLSPAECVSRVLPMRGVADKDLAGAVSFEIEQTHPFGENGVTAWAALPAKGAVLVAAARRDTVEDRAALLAEAGIPLASVTTPVAAIRAARGWTASPPPLLALEEDSSTFVYGESEHAPVFWAVLDGAAERVLPRVRAQMRLMAEEPAADLRSVLPAERLSGGGALIAACPWLFDQWNLLDPARRASRSRWALAPTAVLAGVLVLGGAAVAAFPAWEERRLSETLQAEVRLVEPQAIQSAQAAREEQAARSRAAGLKAFRDRTRQDLDALKEVTRLLAPPAWSSSLDLTRQSIAVVGESQTATDLLKAFDASPLFRNSEFVAPLARAQSGMDTFRLRAERREPPAAAKPEVKK